MKKVENFRPERECRMSPGAKIYNGLGLADQAYGPKGAVSAAQQGVNRNILEKLGTS